MTRRIVIYALVFVAGFNIVFLVASLIMGWLEEKRHRVGVKGRRLGN